MSKKDVEQLAREALFVRFYERGYISSGKAAELLGISRRAFLDILGQYHVSEFDEEMNLKQELSNATVACCMQHQIAPDGKEFILTEADDFEQEVEQLRNSIAFQRFLDERSSQCQQHMPLDDVLREIEAELACQPQRVGP